MRPSTRAAGGSVYLHLRMHFLPGMHRVDGSGMSELRRRTGAPTAEGEDGCASVVAAISHRASRRGAFQTARQTYRRSRDRRIHNEAIIALKFRSAICKSPLLEALSRPRLS